MQAKSRGRMLRIRIIKLSWIVSLSSLLKFWHILGHQWNWLVYSHWKFYNRYLMERLYTLLYFYLLFYIFFNDFVLFIELRKTANFKMEIKIKCILIIFDYFSEILLNTSVYIGLLPSEYMGQMGQMIQAEEVIA